jgi:lipopolysaccharide/colanic/teichoic acid biosynthesis glycosyltransferase
MSGHPLSVPASTTLPGEARPHSAVRVAIYLCAKRAIDIVVSSIALLVLAIPFAVIAFLIKRQDGGPVFYAHTRVGKNGRRFKFYKFRSMIRDADRLKDQLLALNHHDDARTFKMKSDPRITPLGRWMRRYSVDELPQFLNIWKGDMSLVGPRPPLPREVELYTPEDMRRLEVTPGLTCLWQIRGRGDLPFSEQVKLDVEYVETRGFLLDIEILRDTIPAVISGRGAY